MARILIADDDADVVQFLKSALEAEGYEALSAADAKTAVERLSSGAFDLVILDMGLEGLGPAPAKGLREACPAAASARLLILTGRDLRQENARGALDGADESLEKGCSLDKLNATVKRLLRRTAPRP
jgi:DNA-binding response OmpR family regulator